MTSASFWKADPSAWLDVVGALEGTTWPRGAAVLDVQWHVDRMKFGHPWPSSRELAERWGWGRKKVRLLLQALDPLEQKGPAGAQQGPSRGPARAQRATVKPKESRDRGPAGAQQGPSRGPVGATRAFGTENREQRTENRDPPIAPQGADRVWGAYRAHHPLIKRDPTPDERKLLQRAIRDARAAGSPKPAEAIAAVLDWVHLAPDARFFRGDNDRGTKFLGLATLLKPKLLGEKIDKARAWHEAGRPTQASRRGHDGLAYNPGTDGELLEEPAQHSWTLQRDEGGWALLRDGLDLWGAAAPGLTAALIRERVDDDEQRKRLLAQLEQPACGPAP